MTLQLAFNKTVDLFSVKLLLVVILDLGEMFDVRLNLFIMIY